MGKFLTLLGVGNVGKSSISFDGSTSYVGYNGSGVYSSSSAYWISFWVKGGLQAAGNDRRVYAEANSVSGNQLITFGSRLTTDNKIAVFIRNDAAGTAYGATPKSSTTAVLDNTWHHVLWTDNAGTAALYIDNVLDATSFNYVPSGTYTMDRVGVGAIYRSTGSSNFSGLIDNVVVGTGSLTLSDRNNIYNKTYPTSFIQWLFDEGGGTTAIDSSGNGRNGTITSATYSTDTA